MGLQHRDGTFVQRVQHIDGLQRGQQDARVALNHPQQRVKIAASAIGGQRVEILFVPLVPCAVAVEVELLLFRRKLVEGSLGAVLHHVVEAENGAVRQPLYEGVLLRKGRQQGGGLLVPGDIPGHLRREFVGQPHDRQKFLLRLRQRIDHGGGEHGVDVRGAVRQHALLGQGAQVQIHGGEPALAGVEQRVDLFLRQRRAAAAGVDRQLRVVQPQLLRPDPVDPAAQPHDLRRGKKPVAAGHDQMHVLRQPIGQGADEAGGALVRQQVKVVDEDVAGETAAQSVAKLVRQQSAVSGVGRAGIIPQQVKPRPGKGVLRAFPKDGRIVGIDADPDDPHRLGVLPLAEKPVHRGGLAVAHRRDHGGQRAA